MPVVKRRILFLTVIPSPYQQQLFARLAESEAFDIRVLYYAMGAPDRQWKPPRLASFETVMPGVKLGWREGGTYTYYNPNVFRWIADADAALVVVSDYSAPTAQLAMRGLIGRRWMFWRGRFGSLVRERLQAPLASAAAIAGIGSRAVAAYERLFPSMPVFNIPYFCDLGPYQEASRLRPPRKSDTVDILFSGQLILRKGADILIQAFSRIAPSHVYARLILLGDGPERRSLGEMVPEALRERVVFLGHREPPLIPDIFASADVFCLPSRHDGWGVVINEAIGAGLPIVTSNAVGAGYDLVRDGVNGRVTQVGNIDELAAALRQLVGDPSIRAQYAAASSALALNWGLDEGASRWLTAADSILSSRTTSRSTMI
jgi:glycosyltransferase involved in cell wall biosynthesis